MVQKVDPHARGTICGRCYARKCKCPPVEGLASRVSLVEDRQEVGIDRLSLSFPVRKAPDLYSWDSYSYRPSDGRVTAGSSVHEGGAAVMVGVQDVGGKLWGKVECNPARLRDPDGCSLLPLTELEASVHAMASVVELLGVTSWDPLDAWRVKRVDVARDFRGVTAPGFYVRGLLNLKRAHARRAYLYANPSAGNAETLGVGSGAGMVRLYDQHEAYAEKGAPSGAVRFEVEARGGWLESVGVGRAESLAAGPLEALAVSRWEWSKMGTEVTGSANVVEAVDRLVRADVLSSTKAQRLLGQLVAESLGVSWPTAKGTSAEYSRFKAQLGVVPSAELFQAADVTVRGRLDFGSGLELVA